MKTKPSSNQNTLFSEIRQLIDDSKKQLLIAVNSAMSYVYWQVGGRINKEVDGKDRSELYGKEVVTGLCKSLSEEFGPAFSEKNIRRMMQFARIFPEEEIVVSLIRQLSWTHIVAILPIDDPLKRNFYIEMCKLEKWSVRTFRERINSMLYEKTAISKKPEQTISSELANLSNHGAVSDDLVFRDPYILDFLGLADSFSEKDMESAILFELQNFIIELGSDFAFLARQKRITIDNDDYYIGLLFFHRRLKRLVALDLKLGKFKAEHKGQMELYLRWLEKHEKNDGENDPIGLILCADKNEEHVELLELNKSNIRVAEYLTVLPDKKILENKLHLAIERARNRLLPNE